MTLCILCPGQGSQSPGMLDELLADDATRSICRDLAGLLAFDAFAMAADPAHCFANRYAQPLICLYGMSVWMAIDANSIKPALAAGYSVGELSAWGVAGALAPPAVLRAAAARAAAMDACAPADAGMLAVRGVRLAAIEAAAAAEGAVAAIRNGADHAVLAGPNSALDALQEALVRNSAAHVVRLPISVPAHSPWLAPAVHEFAEFLATLPWHEAAHPVLAGIDGQPRDRTADAVPALSRQLAAPLEWAQSMDVAVEMGVSCFFELGPGDGLCRMLRERHPEVEARALGDFASTAGAVDWLKRNPS